jgi:hypothetical protein
MMSIIPYGHWRPQALGDVPNDFEASVDLQYIPVRQGWYYGTPVDGRGYPGSGLGDAASDSVQQLAKATKFQTILQVISTLSIATMAGLAIARAIQTRRGGRTGPFLGKE